MFLSFVRTCLRFLQAITYKLPIRIFYTVSSAKIYSVKIGKDVLESVIENKIFDEYA